MGKINDGYLYIDKLTKRDLFAAMIMQGMMSTFAIDHKPSVSAERAVLRADALIAELAKE